MITLPIPAEAEIQSWVGEESFRRGLRYFRLSAISQPRRQGAAIKARCKGNGPEPYRVSVTFDHAGLTRAECSCPIGSAGRCKHVAALLLAWRDQPASFVEIEDLDAVLDRRTRAELVGLIHELLQHAPDLETLVEVPVPDHDARRSQGGS
jgi:uncharacterized Zn finger protein